MRISGELPVIATVALTAGPWLFLHGFRDLRVRRLIQNTPTAKIRSMAMGLVEVNGAVEERSTVSAPFSGRPCVHWEVEIAVRNGRRRSWSTVHRNSSGNPFFLRDETGIALVYPQGAQSKITFAVEETCAGIMLPDCYSQYLKEQHLTASALWRLSEMRFRERVLEAGQRVYVLGTAMPRAQSLAVSLDDEWQATGTDDPAAQRLRTLNEEVVAVIRQGQNEPTFIVSQESERDLTLDLGLHALGKLIGGPALTVFGLGYWLYALTQGR